MSQEFLVDSLINDGPMEEQKERERDCITMSDFKLNIKYIMNDNG